MYVVRVCVCACVHACVSVSVCAGIYSLPSDPLRFPSLTVGRVTNSVVGYQAQRNDGITNALITGYNVIRFRVSMIGEYVNAGSGRRVAISPAVPGAQYRITAWARGDSTRSATPAVEDVTTVEARECGRHVYI